MILPKCQKRVFNIPRAPQIYDKLVKVTVPVKTAISRCTKASNTTATHSGLRQLPTVQMVKSRKTSGAPQNENESNVVASRFSTLDSAIPNEIQFHNLSKQHPNGLKALHAKNQIIPIEPMKRKDIPPLINLFNSKGLSSLASARPLKRKNEENFPPCEPFKVQRLNQSGRNTRTNTVTVTGITPLYLPVNGGMEKNSVAEGSIASSDEQKSKLPRRMKFIKSSIVGVFKVPQKQ